MASSPRPNSVQEDRLKIPIINLVVETKSSAPSSPANGQVYYSTTDDKFYGRAGGTFYQLDNQGVELLVNKGATNGYAALVSGTVPIAQIPTGTTGTTVPFGNDSRFSDQRTPTDNSVTSAKIVDGTIVDGDVAAANKDGSAGTPSLRTLGYTGTTAMPGIARHDQIAAANTAWSNGGQKITNGADGTAATDFATFGQVQAIAQGRAEKDAVDWGTTANITLSGLGTQAGGEWTGTLATTDRVVVMFQSTAANNGIYNPSSGAWTRTTDADTAAEINKATVLVTNGATYKGDTYTQSATVTTLGTDAQTWIQTGEGAALTLAAVGAVPNANGASLSGQQLTLQPANASFPGVMSAAGFSKLAAAPVGYSSVLGALSAGIETVVTHAQGLTHLMDPSFMIVSSGQFTTLGVRYIDSNSFGITSDVAYGAAAIQVNAVMF